MGFIQLHLIPLKVDGVLPGPLGHLDLLYMSTQQTSTQAGESFAALFAESIEIEASAQARANWTGNQS